MQRRIKERRLLKTVRRFADRIQFPALPPAAEKPEKADKPEEQREAPKDADGSQEPAEPEAEEKDGE